MLPSRLFLLGSLAVSSCLGSQAAFGIPSPNEAASAENVYKLKWPVKKVAIIGAGPGGLLVYRELTQAGFDVHIFERDELPGGNWHYTDEIPVDAPVPNADPSIGDYVPSRPPAKVKLPYSRGYSGSASELRRQHRGPKPVWESLKSNAPAPVQQITELPWPVGTKWELPQYKLGQYLRAFASYHGVNSNDNNPNVYYNTRVELVEKRYDEHGKERGWKLLVKELVQTRSNTSRATWREEDFDAVVVATGRYNAPNVPAIPGLADLAQRFPERLTHSRQYRRPDPFTNQTILIVGAAVSGGEISREVNPYARKVYQSIRTDNSTKPHFFLDVFLKRLPENTTVIPEIKRFLPLAPDANFSDAQIELVNGTVITGVDNIIFGTGYRYTFPFLPQYHNSSIGLDERATGGALQPLVTDGTHVRSLHLDLFYIEEPTIVLINMNIGMQSFTYAEYLGLAAAKVWDEKAFLPSTEEMWRLYEERVEDRGGHGPHFQFLGAERTEVNIRYFLAWLNAAAVKYGGRQIDSIPTERNEAAFYFSMARFGIDVGSVKFDEPNNTFWSALGLDPVYLSAVDDKEMMDSTLFNDWW